MIRELLIMLGKDFRLFARDKRTVILVTLAPLLIMIILSSIFSSEASAIRNIKVGVCDFGSNITFDIPAFEEIYLIDENCEAVARNLVSSGKLRAAVIIPENFDADLKEGRGAVIKAYADNSKSQLALVSSNAIAAYVQGANEKTGIEFIEQAWESLRKLNEQLGDVQKKLDAGIAYSQDAQEKINSAMGISQELEIPSQDIAALNKKLDDVLFQVNSINLSRPDAEALQNISDKISAIPEISGQVENLSDEVSILCANTSGCEKINVLLENLKNTSVGFDSDIEVLWKEINILINFSAINNEKINEANSSLAGLYENISQARENLAAFQERLANLSLAKQAYSEKLVNLNETIGNLTSDLANLNLQLNETRNVLAAYTSKEPQSIIRPITFEEIKVFPQKKYIYFVAPALICIILLFIITLTSSSNIVYERKSGTMVRNVLSPAPLLLFMVEKLVYFIILSFIQIALMLAVLFAFGVSFAITLVLIAMFLVISLVFTALGLLIGNISKSENTALLTSLVLSIPMLFLSGAFFAFEIMPEFMQNAAKVLPLTVAIDSFEKLVIYKTPVLLEDILYLLIMSALFFVISVLLIKKEGVIK